MSAPDSSQLRAGKLVGEIGFRQLVTEQGLLDEHRVCGRVALRVIRCVVSHEPEQAGARGRDDHRSRGRKPQVETGRRSHRTSLVLSAATGLPRTPKRFA